MKKLYQFPKQKNNLLKKITCSLIFIFFAINLSATIFNVNTVNDTHAATPGAGTGLDGSGSISFRSALEAANAVGGTHTINVPAGTYNIILGAIIQNDIPQNITINGVSSSTTIVNMTTTLQDRILIIGTSGTQTNMVTSINNIQFKGGKLTSDNFGGGAIIAGGPNNSLTLTNCNFNNNTIDASQGGNGGAVRYNGGGSLIITGCTFSNNSNSVGYGGAVSYFLENLIGAGNGSVSITNNVFNNNTVANNNGGALDIAAQGIITGGITFTASVLRNQFIANTATGTTTGGGAVLINNGFDIGNIVTVNYNRFYNNTAAAGPSALAQVSAQGNVNADNNWWGCNAGPTVVSACDKGAIIGSGGVGTFTATKWLQLKATAATSPICATTGTSTITASYLSNSANETITTTNLSAIVGTPISFTATLGAISGAQTTIQANGTATATYTAGATTGSGNSNAVVDNTPNTDVTARATVQINNVSVTNPITTTGANGVSYSQNAGASGGVVPYSFATTSTLPNGITLSTAGVLSGTPTQGGTFPIVINATDANSCVGSGTSFNLVITGPTITTTGTPLAAFTACSGTALAEQNFTTSGSNLTNNITLTAPTGFEISTTSGSGFNTSITLTQSGGTVASTTIYVRLAATATGTPSGNITLASTGVTTVNVAVNGTINTLPIVNAGANQTICASTAATLTATCNLLAVTTTLSGVNEVPANASTATGIVNGTFNNITNQLILNISFNGLAANASAAHIHKAGVGVNGPVVIGFAGFPAVATGSFTYTGTLTALQAADLLAGLYYVNVHNSAFPGGEIRGQLNTTCAANTFSWDNGGGLGQTVSVTPPITTVYTLTSSNSVSGCSSTSQTTVTVTTLPATPTITAGGPTTFCIGGSVTLTSSSATGNVWSTTETTQSITVTTAGTYTVTVTSGGCTSTASVGTTVTVDPLPTTSNAGADINACINPGTANMAANTPTVGTGVWSQISGPVTTSFGVNNPITIVVGLNTAGNYTYVWTITNGTCTPSRDTVNIVVNPNPTPFTLSGGGTFCPSTQTLTGPVDPNYTYVWQKSLTGISNPNSFTSFGGTISTQDVSISGVYRLNVTNQFGCITSDTTAVSIADYVFNGSLAAGDAQQTGRLNRFAVLSTCAAPKGCPLTFATTGARFYDSYTITNPSSVPVCATIGLRSDCGNSLFNVAYLGSFNPTQPCTNYLADPGSSFPGTGYMEATIPANATIVVVVHEVNPGTGCTGYQLTVDVPRDMTAVTATPSSVNFNATSSLAAPVANSYLWSPGGATTQSITSAPITATGTKYFVDLGYGNNGCTRKDSVTINLSCTLPVLTCPTSTTTAACQTQAAVNTAFATWLATAAGSGGTNGVLTNNNTGAPSACGGSTTVTFTYTNDCPPLVSTCQATFTVSAAPTIILTAPTNTTTAACQTQAAVNTAFATWLSTASASGGCNGVLTNNNTGAPSACGGSTTVTFTYNSSCAPLTTTTTATFTVTAAPTVVLTAPTNTTTAACQTQAAVNTAFATWLSTASASGGCNGALINNNTGAPSACGGSTTVTFTYNSSCAPLTTTTTATFTVTAAPTVVLTAPTNTTTAACQTQAAVNTAFATWLSTVVASGGCNGALINNNTGAPSACGGSTTVTFTYNSSCAPLTTTATATFTVSAAPTIVLTAPTNTTTAACQTQAAVNTAFATWLSTANASGGCNGVLTNNNTGAPSACGGSTTVTFTYNSSCAPLSTTAQATFTITAAPTVVLTAPTNTTTAACQTQAAVNTAFATWLSTVVASGGCNGSLTNNNTGAPSACGGSTTVTFTYNSSCAPSTTTATATFTVTASPTVVLTAPTNTTTAACQTQAAVNTAFATWLSTVVASGGCNGSLTNNNTGAPSACGGSTTVTFTYNSSCAPLTTTAQATFTVAAPPTIIISCPAPTTVTCVALIPSPNVSSVTINAGCNVTVTHRGDVISNQICANKYLITRTYRGTDLCGNFVECTQLITVNDNVVPTITCSAAITVCGVANVPAVNISSVTATDNCIGAVTITHRGDVSTPSATAPYIITRTYRATDVCGNFAECTQLITVNPIAIVNAVANQVVCNGSPVTTIAFGTTATGGTVVYNWSNSTTSIGLAANGIGNIASFNGTNITNAPITATITVTPTFTNNAVSCVGTASTFTLTVNPTPSVNAVANIAFCNAVTSTVIPFSGFVPGTVYSWTNSNTAIGLGANGTGNLPAFTPTNAGTTPITATITVTPSFTNGGVTCTGASTSFVITVNPTTRITVHPVNSSICFGSSTAFAVTATGLNLTYQWQIDYGNGFNNIVGATNATYQVAIPPNGGINYNNSKYRCIVTGTCGIENSNTVTLTILPTPTVSISASPTSILQPFQSTNVLANVSPTGGTFKWYYNDVLINGATNTSFGPIGINDLGNYKFVYTDVNGCIATSTNQPISGAYSENLWVYPNPNKGQFNVRFYNQNGERFTVSIYSSKRELIYSADLITGSTYSETTVDLNNQPSGTYVLVITNSLNKKLVNKLIVIAR